MNPSRGVYPEVFVWKAELWYLFISQYKLPRKHKELSIFYQNYCTLHQPRHVKMLVWLDLDCTHEAVVSKGKGKLAEGGIFSSCQQRDHFGEE